MRYTFFLPLLLAGPAWSAEPADSWQSRADDPDRVYLYRDGQQIGGWCYRTGRYRPFDGEAWGSPRVASPAAPPMRAQMPERNVVTRSVNWQISPRPRGVRGRMGAAMGETVANMMTDLTLQVFIEALKEAQQSIRSGSGPIR